VNKFPSIKTVLVADLIPYARNSRTHSEEQVTQIAASIKEFGFLNPVIIDGEKGIIAGHGRVMAAKKLGMTELPAVEASHLTDAQRRAYIIADNKLALNAGWDDEMLRVEFAELTEAGFDLDLTGFSLDEIGALQIEEIPPGLTDEDAVPEVPAQPVTVEGDVWLLGRHRLMCGDSTSIDAVDKLMDGQKASICFTSPPYNGDTKSKHGDYYATDKTQKFYGNDGFQDNLQSAEYIDFTSTVLGNCFNVVDGYIFWNVSYNANSRFEYIKQIEGFLPNLIEQICWKKTSNFPLKGSMMRQWEPVYVFSTHMRPLGLKEVTGNHWEISNTGAQHESHKACFPVALVEKAIAMFSGMANSVLDPFGGSGTSLIAGEKQSCQAFLMELDPKYCDVIIKRWQDFTGKQATLEATGETFEVLSNVRLP
jgi:DNA modification methylase